MFSLRAFSVFYILKYIFEWDKKREGGCGPPADLNFSLLMYFGGIGIFFRRQSCLEVLCIVQLLGFINSMIQWNTNVYILNPILVNISKYPHEQFSLNSKCFSTFTFSLFTFLCHLLPYTNANCNYPTTTFLTCHHSIKISFPIILFVPPQTVLHCLSAAYYTKVLRLHVLLC